MIEEKPQQISKPALLAMGVILLAFALLAVFSNWQNANRAQVESTTITRLTPAPTAIPSATH